MIRSRLHDAVEQQAAEPGMTKTRSTTTAPTSRVASWRPSTVTTGMAALRSPCRRSAAIGDSPLARAVRR